MLSMTSEVMSGKVQTLNVSSAKRFTTTGTEAGERPRLKGSRAEGNGTDFIAVFDRSMSAIHCCPCVVYGRVDVHGGFRTASQRNFFDEIEHDRFASFMRF